MILWLQSAVGPLLQQSPGFTGVCRNHVPGTFLAKRATTGLIAAISSYARYLSNVTLAAATATERSTLDAIRL